MIRLFINRTIAIIILNFCVLNVFSAEHMSKAEAVFEKYKIEKNELNKYAAVLRTMAEKNIQAQDDIEKIKSGKQMAELLRKKEYAFQDYNNTYINLTEPKIYEMALNKDDIAALKKTILYLSYKACLGIINFFLKNAPLYANVKRKIGHGTLAIYDNIPNLSKEVKESFSGDYVGVFNKIANWQKQVLKQVAERKVDYNDVLQDNSEVIIGLAKLYNNIGDLEKAVEPGSADIFRAKFMQDFSLNVANEDYDSDFRQALFVAYPIISKIVSENSNAFIEGAKKINMLDLLPQFPVPQLSDIKKELKDLKIDTSFYKLMQYSSLIMAYYNFVFCSVIIKLVQLGPIVNGIILQGYENVRIFRYIQLLILCYALFDKVMCLFLFDNAKIMFYSGNLDDVFPVISSIWRPTECISGIVASGVNVVGGAIATFTSLDEETRLNGVIFTMMYYNFMVLTIFILNSLAETKGKITEINPLAIVNKVVNANTMLFFGLLDTIFDTVDFCKDKVQSAANFYEECCQLRKQSSPVALFNAEWDRLAGMDLENQ